MTGINYQLGWLVFKGLKCLLTNDKSTHFTSIHLYLPLHASS